MKEWRWFHDLLFAPTAHALFTVYLHVFETLYTPCSRSLASSYVNLRNADNLHFVKNLSRPPRSYMSAIPLHEKKPNTIFTTCYKTSKNYEDSKGHPAS